VIRGDVGETYFIDTHLLEYLRNGDVLLNLFSKIPDSLLFPRFFEDCQVWCCELRTKISNWKERSLSLIKQNLEEAKHQSRVSLRDKNPTNLKYYLDVLSKYQDFDPYFQPTPSSIYLDTCSYLRSELNSLAQSANYSLERGDLEKYNGIRLFLEDSTSYGIHFKDMDFKRIISSMFEKHQQVVDCIPEEVQKLLAEHNYRRIRVKLMNIQSDNPEIFQEWCCLKSVPMIQEIYLLKYGL